MDYNRISIIINGPIIACLFIIGTLLNLITLFILKMNPRQKYYSETSQIPNHSQTEYSILHAANNIAIYVTTEEGDRLRLVPIKKLPKTSPIRIYLCWLTSCDTVLLISAFFTYSIPTLFDCYSNVFAYFLPLLYMLCNATLTISVWQTLLLMVERWRALSSDFISAISALIMTRGKCHRKLCIGNAMFTLGKPPPPRNSPRISPVRIPTRGDIPEVGEFSRKIPI